MRCMVLQNNVSILFNFFCMIRHPPKTTLTTALCPVPTLFRSYSVEPALVFNDPVAAREGLEPLTRIPGIARLRVLNDVSRPVTEWTSPTADPAPMLSRIFFPRPFAVTVERNGSAIGPSEV